MIVKVAFEKQIHLYRGQLKLSKLKNHCQNVFKALPKPFQFYYYDNDNDQITINSQQDLDIIQQLEQKAIKKLFIKQSEAEFQLLTVEDSNPQNSDLSLSPQIFCKIPRKPIQSSPIKTINPLKQSIIHNQLVKRQAKSYLQILQNKLIDEYLLEKQKEENSLISEQVKKFMEKQISGQIVEKIIQEEEKIIEKEVKVEVEKMIQNCSDKMAKISIREIKEIGVQNSCQKKERQEDIINRIVQEKINRILPGLIKKIGKMVQARMEIGCGNCQKREKQLEKRTKSFYRHHEW